MSIRSELERLKRKKEKLTKRLEEICSELKELYEKKDSYINNIENLSVCNSFFAKTLLKKAQEELERISQEIRKVEKVKEGIIKEVDEINPRIEEMLDNPNGYIQEQSSVMISDFMEYVRLHKAIIGAKIKKTYHIDQVTKFEDDRYGGCDIPTGNIGIYDESNRNPIISSKDFCFSNTLYTLERGDYDELICHYTDWYVEYRNNFIRVLLETLQNMYCFDDCFKLTIEDSCFTFELV